MLQNNVPVGKPLLEINKGVGINNNCLIKTNLKENNNISINLNETPKKEHNIVNQTIVT
jgi:hypothetical protein